MATELAVTSYQMPVYHTHRVVKRCIVPQSDKKHKIRMITAYCNTGRREGDMVSFFNKKNL